jgi:hypothetical protein
VQTLKVPSWGSNVPADITGGSVQTPKLLSLGSNVLAETPKRGLQNASLRYCSQLPRRRSSRERLREWVIDIGTARGHMSPLCSKWLRRQLRRT